MKKISKGDIMINRIKDLREDRDMRQIDLANAVGIDQRTLSNYETGKTKPDSDSLIKLADFFNVSIVESGILYLTINYEPDSVGDIEKSILIITKKF